MFTVIKNAAWLHTLFIRLNTAIHPMVAHNIGKHNMLRKALHHTAIEKIEGAYAEFGVYEGTSLLAAVKTHRAMSRSSSSKFYKTLPKRQFYGYDAFEQGFRYEMPQEEHPFFVEGDFSSSWKACKKRFKSYANVTLVKGYFEQTLQGSTFKETYNDALAVVFIDCDLKHPAYCALCYCADSLQPGSVIILDDFYSYKGDPTKGVSGAWQQFLAEHPAICAREFHPYGYTGMAFIVYANTLFDGQQSETVHD